MDRALLPQDAISGNVNILEPEHGRIHEGTHFTVAYNKTIAATASTSTLMITTPTAGAGYIHFVCGVEADKAVTWTLFKDTQASVGSAITAYNNNLNSTNTNPVTIVANPTITTYGTVLEAHIAGSSSTQQTKTGGGVNARNEWLLKPSSSYMVRVTSTDATTKTVIDIPYYYRIP